MIDHLLRDAIYQTVAYADVFNYPMTARQIHRYLHGHLASLAEVEHCLAANLPSGLETDGTVYYLSGRGGLAALRRERERTSSDAWRKAITWGKRIGGMPYVRLVGLTGSLAVGNAADGADYDYFILTEPGRLWICRAWVILIVRAAQVRGVGVCPNYLLGASQLGLSEQTLFAAHELAQMVPLAGSIRLYNALRDANPWVYRFLPNAAGPPPENLLPGDTGKGLDTNETRGMGKQLVEGLLNGRMWNWLEHWEMERKRRKFATQYTTWENAALSPDCCKGHFKSYNQPALLAYESRLAAHAVKGEES